MSRKISDLNPNVAEMCGRHIEACNAADIQLVVYSTRRTEAEQALLYAQGRYLDQLPDAVAALIAGEIRHWREQGYYIGPGNIVTRRYGPDCPHVLGIAYDCVAVVDGKAVWNDLALWERIGTLGEAQGAEWGGRWPTFPDRPHFQQRRET